MARAAANKFEKPRETLGFAFIPEKKGAPLSQTEERQK